MAINMTSSFAGEVYEDFLARMTMGAETMNAGLLAVHNRIMKEKKLPRINATNLVQPYADPPVSQGDFTVDERSLVPVDWMIYSEFNPRDFEVFHEFANPTVGEVLDRTLPLAAQVAFLQQIAIGANESLETNIWTGTTSASYWNGLHTRIAADGDVNSVASPVALNASLIQAEIARTKAALIGAGSRGRAVWNSPLCRILMSHRDADFYRDSLEDMSQNKGPSVTDDYALVYQGRPIVPLSGIPDGKIIITRCSDNPMTSNLHIGIDWQYDTEEPVVQIERVQNNSFKHFVKCLVKTDVNYTWSEEIAYYGGS